MPTKMMSIIRLVLISVLLNAAFVQSEHQLTHLSQSHTIEQCDVCSHPSYLDHLIIPTNYSFHYFQENNDTLLNAFTLKKQSPITISHARAPPFNA